MLNDKTNVKMIACFQPTFMDLESQYYLYYFSYETLAINRGSMLDWQHCQRFIMGQADASFIKQFNYISTYV